MQLIIRSRNRNKAKLAGIFPELSNPYALEILEKLQDRNPLHFLLIHCAIKETSTSYEELVKFHQDRCGSDIIATHTLLLSWARNSTTGTLASWLRA